ncbi:MAG: hypothetical protein RBR86_08890 [Pseudobdellovibrionaceae bacterium]|jgi:hemerythrin-like domain-containing protein|nr:hypothetical protein [Pseudobdellovibrionaceae bacterium]
MILDILTDQHTDILRILDSISNDLRTPEKLNPQGVSKLRSSLSILTGKLRVHISMESQNVYTKCAHSNNAELSQSAKNLKNEMDSFTMLFMEYNKKWSAASDIADDMNSFINETVIMFQNLKIRFDAQETGIYDLLRDQTDLLPPQA